MEYRVSAGERGAASPTALLPSGIPQVLIHGTDDDSVPLEISQSYLAKANAAGDNVVLIELAWADHFVLIDAGSAAWTITVDEIKKMIS
jgi:pimeloyl-ACP methyl ester carboxylesterase